MRRARARGSPAAAGGGAQAADKRLQRAVGAVACAARCARAGV